MITAKPHELELSKFRRESDPAAGFRINFPSMRKPARQAPRQSTSSSTRNSTSECTVPRRSCSSSRVMPRRLQEARGRDGGGACPCIPRPLQRRRGHTASARLLLQRGGSDDLRRSPRALGHEGPTCGQGAASSGLVRLARSTFHRAGATIVPGPLHATWTAWLSYSGYL
jgi:hypothetical protein